MAAAGNSSGPVEYPGALKNSYCVSAVGQTGRYPDDTIHKEAEPSSRGLFGRDNIYAAEFTCRGNVVDCCAPGVAIISSVPNDKYAALDGTSMACPIVTGLAALIIDREQQIQNMGRIEQRTDLIRQNLNATLDDVRLPIIVQGKGFTTI